jgi:hypothetical protein
MKRIAFALFFAASGAFAANDPIPVAESALAAWKARDGTTLAAISDTEFRARCRHARVFESPVTDRDLKQRVLASGSDREVVELLCQAVAKLAPNPQKSIYTYVKTIAKGDLLILVFSDGWISQTTGKVYGTFETKVVLKKEGDEWRYLWSPAASIYVDLNWDPTT